MKHLSIDVGYKNLGYCIFNIVDSKFEYLSSGYIGANDKKAYPKEFASQLKFIFNFFKNIIETCDIEVLVYEEPFFRAGNAVGTKITNVVGVLILLCGLFDIKDYSYNATTVKKSISGDGKADKKGVDDSVCKFLNLKLDFKTDHESDSVAVGITHFKEKHCAKSVE